MARLHFVGIAGAFMAGAARLAKAQGHKVDGSDSAFYPPFGAEARALGGRLRKGYNTTCAQCPADLYIIGNAVSRGNPLVEDILRRRRPYTSAPQWLAENVLAKHPVLAVAGTHGKTTTAALLAHILARAGMRPGFLAGGVLPNFGVSARLPGAAGAPFVVEADEYDTAFFDKRPKLMHYRPQVALINNIEYDHADIYPNVSAIVRQFGLWLRLLPANGALIARAQSANVRRAIAAAPAGAPAPQFFGGGAAAHWRWRFGGGTMRLWRGDKAVCAFAPPLAGAANRANIAAALAAAAAVGAPPQKAGEWLQGFVPPLRRLQFLYEENGVRVIDDFAHHPAAIKQTIAAVEEGAAGGRIVAVFEPRSNSMKAGVFAARLPAALARASAAVAVGRGQWLTAAMRRAGGAVCPTAAAAAKKIAQTARRGDTVLLMSNGSFDNLPKLLRAELRRRAK